MRHPLPHPPLLEHGIAEQVRRVVQRPRRDLVRLRQLEEVALRVLEREGEQVLVELVRRGGPRPRRRRGEAWVLQEFGLAHHARHVDDLRLARHEVHVAVGADAHPRRRHGAPDLAQVVLPRVLIAHQHRGAPVLVGGLGAEQRELDVVALARHLRLPQRDHRRARRAGPRVILQDVLAQLHRLAPGEPRRVHRPPHGVGDDLRRLEVPVRPAPSEAGDRDDDEARAAARKTRVVQSQRLALGLGAKLSTTISACSASSSRILRPARDAASSVTLRLFVLRCRNEPLFSGSASSRWNGGAARWESPPGGSILMTSAPWSASSLVQ